MLTRNERVYEIIIYSPFAACGLSGEVKLEDTLNGDGA